MTPTPPWTFAGATDTGLVRRRNEDRYRIVEGSGIAIVTDGMGGHPGGDVASMIAAHVLADRLTVHLANPGSAPHFGNDITALRDEAMRASVEDAHRAVRERGRSEPRLEGMGTTMVAFVLFPGGRSYTLGHVGDSRGYRLREGRIRRLTRDHTLLEAERAAGRVDGSGAYDPRWAHQLTRVVGYGSELPRPDVVHGEARPGDIFVLCSDGLSGELSDPEIEAVLRSALPIDPVPGQEAVEAAARALVAAAVERGGSDNVTVVLALVR